MYRVMMVIGAMFGVVFMGMLSWACLGFFAMAFGNAYAVAMGFMLAPAVLATGYMMVIDAWNDE